MKRIIPIVLLCFLLLAGCGRADAETPDASAPPEAPEETAAVPEITLTPEQEAALIPSGTWLDDEHPNTSLVLDENCAGSLVVVDEDGGVTTWTFSGVYDSASGSITYSDCSKQVYAPDGSVTTTYTDGKGSFTNLDGFLYWHDEMENAGEGYVYHLAE
ncbi:MAG: hypothetical protein IJ112_05645 [Oscillospiraceae bacterium]|nr:hypothetical protein [Oscillospiraceae bacterium]